MAYFHPRCSSVSDASYRHAPQRKVCAVFSVQERIAAFEESMDAAKTTTGSFRRLSTPLTQNMKSSSFRMPSPSFKPAETQRSSMPSHQKNMMMKSVMKANTNIYSNTSASFTSSMQSWNSYRRTESTTLLKSETQQSKVTSFSKEVHRNSKVSLAQQSAVSKEQSFIYSNGSVENIISAKSPRLPEREKPNYMRAYGAQNKVQRQSTNPSVPLKGLPAVYALGKAPPKPNRPPSVDIRRFRRNIKSPKDSQYGTKIPPPVAPRPTPPSLPLQPLRSCPSSNHAAALTQQVDEDDNYDDVGIMNPPPLPEEHPSKRKEAELNEDTYDDIDNICVEQAEKSKRNQESNSRKEDTNHGKVTNEKRAKEKAKKEKKKQQKQQKIKEEKDKEAQKKSKIQGHAHIIKKGKALIGLKGGKSDLSLNQEEIVEVVHNTDDSEKTESVDAGHDEIKEEKEEPGSDAECDIHDDIGVPVEVCSGPTVQNPEEEDDLEENLDIRNDIYDDVGEDTTVYIVPTK